MRLKSLYIKEYKNIHDQTFDFSGNDGYIALIGLNGSGKSNLLEAIGLIFDSILDKHQVPFDYKIEYEHDGKKYLRTRTNRKIDGKRDVEANMVYPSSVIACYSGEDLRLWHLVFETYYMQYFSQAIRNQTFSPRLIYVNKYCWKIAFIALLCSEKIEITDFLTECLNIQDIASVDCCFSFDNTKMELFKDHQAFKWFKRIQGLQSGSANNNINANIIKTIDMSMYGVSDASKRNQYIFQYLYLLSMPKKYPEKGQMVDKLITDIKIKIGDIDFDGLSEGIKKMILVECVTQVLGDEKSLVLLDEPDAHVHVEYKKKLLKTMNVFNGQMFFTTHSPVLANYVQQEHRNNLFLMKDGRLINSDVVNKLSDISGEEVDFISNSVVVGSKYILVVEGISDVRCITKAIDVWSKKDVKYKRLELIKLLSAGGSGDVQEIFSDILFSQIDYIEKVVYLFDVDDAGKKGYNKIEELKGDDSFRHCASKITSIYYKSDLSQNFELEDLFPEDAYKHIVDKLHELKTYRDFKNRSKKTTIEIKDYIKDNVFSFEDDFFDNFKPILDKLLEVFALT